MSGTSRVRSSSTLMNPGSPPLGEASQSPSALLLDITANAFLLHMVRNIAAALRDVGEGHQPAGWVAEILAGRDRKPVGPTAPARGLYLVGVRYPDHDFPPGEPPPLLRLLGGLDRV